MRRHPWLFPAAGVPLLFAAPALACGGAPTATEIALLLTVPVALALIGHTGFDVLAQYSLAHARRPWLATLGAVPQMLWIGLWSVFALAALAEVPPLAAAGPPYFVPGDIAIIAVLITLLVIEVCMIRRVLQLFAERARSAMPA